MAERAYQKLIVWKEAHTLCLQIYRVTKEFPADERFALVSQMRRSAYSVPTNLAEGNGRRSKAEHAHFVNIAQGSLEELHYQCILARDLHYLSESQFTHLQDLIQKVGYLLSKLFTSLK